MIKIVPAKLLKDYCGAIIFLFFLLVLTGCLTLETTSKSKIFVERPAEVAKQKQPVNALADMPAQDYLELSDSSKLVRHTLQINVTVKNTGEREIVLTRLCADIYDYFNRVLKKDVWFMVVPIGPREEKHIKKDFYTEPTQSQIPKDYSIRICGAVYGKGVSS